MRLEETRQISDFRKLLLARSSELEFDPAPYERATVFLESLSRAEFVDDRVQLAWDVCVAIPIGGRPDIARRALYASFPAGSQIRDDLLKRRWFTAAGVFEAALGNIQRALKYKIVALELSARGEPHGFCVEWGNLATIMAGAGRYEEAIQYATVAIKANGIASEKLPELTGAGCMNRGTALFRLGRFREAAQDLGACLASISFPASGRMLERLIMAQYTSAEIALELGDRTIARAALQAATTWSDRSGMPRTKLALERVRARLSVGESGYEVGVSNLERLLRQAIELEGGLGEPVYDDLIHDILHTLERVCRERGDAVRADKWLNTLGARLRTNAAKIFAALEADTDLAEALGIDAKLAEVDRYLCSKSLTLPARSDAEPASWSYVIGLAASASSIEDSSKEHGVRVARLAGLVARELNLSSDLQSGLEAGCLVHDLGKVAIPPNILLKQTPLEAGEQQLYDSHPAAGAELIEKIKMPDPAVVHNVVRLHHHPYSGDLDRKSPKADAIPIEARIASVCDRYDALVPADHVSVPLAAPTRCVKFSRGVLKTLIQT